MQKEAGASVSFQRDIPLNKKGCGAAVMLPPSLPPAIWSEGGGGDPAIVPMRTKMNA